MDRKRKRTLLRIGLLLFLLMLSLPAGGFQKASAAETPFSLPIRGAAVYPVRAVSLNGRTLKAGTAMVALKESGSRVQVSFQSETGWIGRNLLAVNLPDVLPDIVYDMNYNYSAVMKASGVPIPGVTGCRLYSWGNRKTGKWYNPRLERKEFTVPVSIAFAHKIAALASLAEQEGYQLMIWDAYRPYQVTVKIYKAASALAAVNQRVREGFSANGWNQGWFLSSGVSAHNRLIAIDCTLLWPDGEQPDMPSNLDELSWRAAKVQTPGSTVYASGMTEASKDLDRMAAKAGMRGIASEWWHFQDTDTYGIGACSWIPQKPAGFPADAE